MLNEDNQAYFNFTAPQRLDKAIHTLEGIVSGITADGKTTSVELAELIRWVGEHQQFSQKQPFKEVILRINEAVADNHLDDEERADLLYLCRKFTTENSYFDSVTSDMQRLHGYIRGISSDGKIGVAELRSLQEWLDSHENLKGVWPYDELEAILITVLKDGKIDATEQGQLLSFFSEFSSTFGHRAIELTEAPIDKNLLIKGVCAVCPEMEFENRKICFTGTSKRMPRRKLVELILDKGAIFSKSVTKDLDYLIVGADGNPCWAFSCYGRKVEEAVSLRKRGASLMIVHEYDFWDTVGV